MGLVNKAVGRGGMEKIECGGDFLSCRVNDSEISQQRGGRCIWSHARRKLERPEQERN